MPAPFQTSRRVEFHETDAAGIMHFASMMTLMEEAEHEFLRHLQLPLFRQTGDGKISWPRASVSCDFKSPAHFEDVLEIDVVVQRLGRRSITYGFTLRCHGRVVATGSMTSVCCLIGKDTIRSADNPPDVAEKLSKYVVE